MASTAGLRGGPYFTDEWVCWRLAMKTEALIDPHSTVERTSARMFGLSLTIVFVGMLLLNAISF
jgi:hypothetical protein